MTKFARLLSAVALVALVAAPAAAETWNVDTLHSTLNFKVRHMLANTTGHFGEWSGTITTEGDDLTKGSVQITVQAASIDTDNSDRDNHLRSADFFDVETHPTLTFESTKVEKKGDGYVVTGNFTMIGVTKEIVIPFEFLGTAVDPWGNTKAAFAGQTEINRKDFGMVWNKALDQGGFVLGDTVKIEFEIQAALAQSGK